MRPALPPRPAAAAPDRELAPVAAGRPRLRRLSARIDEVLARVIPPGARCALVQFPDHSNVGDSAIWLGERAALQRAGAKVVYRCDPHSYSRDALAASVPSGPILVHGGGSLGDVWNGQQRLREQILVDFPDRTVIQLPQSIWFEHPDRRDRFRALCERHTGFTLLVRERQSLEIARRHFEVPVELCPDLSFALGGLRRPRPPECAVLWLSRADRESRGFEAFEPPAGVERTDWVIDGAAEWAGDPGGRAAFWWSRKLSRRLRDDRPWTRPLWRLLAPTYEVLAHARLDRGCRTLARGRAVVTDRLHGHVLCVLLGIPHVVLDNSYGKVASSVETWTLDEESVHRAERPRQAVDLALCLAGREDDACG